MNPDSINNPEGVQPQQQSPEPIPQQPTVFQPTNVPVGQDAVPPIGPAAQQIQPPTQPTGYQSTPVANQPLGSASSYQQQSTQPASAKSSNKVLKVVGIVVLVLIVLGVIGAVLSGSKSNNSPSSSTSKSGTTSNQFVDSQAGFKITPPTGWSSLTPQPGILAVFRSPDTDSGGVHPYINVVTTQAQGASLSQLVSETQTSYSQQVQNYKNLDSQPETISGLPAILFSYSATEQGHDLTSAQLIVIKGSTSYSVTGVASSSAWSQYKNAIQNSLLSLQV